MSGSPIETRTSTPRAWVLNLDAEHELEAGQRYSPSNHMRRIVAREKERLVGGLVAAHDVLLDEDDFDPRSPANVALRERQLMGAAWSPTPRALARLAAAGAILPAAPTIDVLQRVNARPFAVEVRRPLIEASFAKRVLLELDEALEQLAEPAPQGWLVRREFGAAGRGRMRIASGRPSDHERSWLVASLRGGPLVIEPWVLITREYTRSGWVRANGEVVISPPCFQETTTEGAWTRTEQAERGAVSREDDARLEEAVSCAGQALARAGYHGAFGIDAFRHRISGASGPHEVLNPLSEINARYTMDWAASMVARSSVAP